MNSTAATEPSANGGGAWLPLFPLQAVLFPGARLWLRVFEARYVDLVGRCLRTQAPFGIVRLLEGREAGRGAIRVEPVGTLAEIREVDGEQSGILRVRCTGAGRFRLAGALRTEADGLWVSEVTTIDDDPVEPPAQALQPTVDALAQAIRSLQAQDTLPFDVPFRFDDAGWVANRWCEILPIPLAAKQRLMALESPSTRLQLVDEYLRGQGVVDG